VLGEFNFSGSHVTAALHKTQMEHFQFYKKIDTSHGGICTLQKKFLICVCRFHLKTHSDVVFVCTQCD
jgi:hypothetical protein